MNIWQGIYLHSYLIQLNSQNNKFQLYATVCMLFLTESSEKMPRSVPKWKEFLRENAFERKWKGRLGRLGEPLDYNANLIKWKRKKKGRLDWHYLTAVRSQGDLSRSPRSPPAKSTVRGALSLRNQAAMVFLPQVVTEKCPREQQKAWSWWISVMDDRHGSWAPGQRYSHSNIYHRCLSNIILNGGK